MSKSLKAILSKKSWTGEEVGRALIANLMNDIKCIGKDHEPLFSQGELDTMTNSLSEEQYNNFRPYHRLNAVLLESYNFLQAKHQQFYNGYYRLINYLKGADAAERARRQAEKYPLILSEDKYHEIGEAAYNERKNIKSTLYDAILVYLSHVIFCCSEGRGHIPDEIRAELEKLKGELATDEKIIKKYNEAVPRGAYVLPSGETDRELSPDDWKEKSRLAFWEAHGLKNEEQAEAYIERCLYKGKKAYYRGKAYLIRQMKREGLDTVSVERESEKKVKQLLHVVIPWEKEAESPFPSNETASGMIYRYVYGADSPIKWKPDKQIPSKYTILLNSLYDVLSFVSKADNIYHAAYGGDKITAKLRFILDYYELVCLARKEVGKCAGILFDCKKVDEREAIEKALTEGNGAELDVFTGSVSAQELHEHGVAGFADFVSVTIYDVYSHLVSLNEDPNKRHKMEMSLLWNGFAVHQKNTAILSTEEKNLHNGFFNPADLVSYADSIEGLAGDEDIKAELKLIQENLIGEALRYLYAYNSFIEVIEKSYDIELEEAKAQMNGIELKIKTARTLLYTLYMEVTGTDEERAAKQKLIKSLFEDPDYMDYMPDPERVEHTVSKYTAQPTYRDKLTNLRTYESDILYLAEEGERYD